MSDSRQKYEELEVESDGLYTGLGPYDFYYTSTMTKPKSIDESNIFRDIIEEIGDWSNSWYSYNQGLKNEVNKPINADELSIILKNKYKISIK